MQASLNFKTFLQLKNQRCESKTMRGFSYYFNCERDYKVFKSKGPCIVFNKKLSFNKNGTESKMENPIQSFRQTNLVLQLI